MGHLDVLLLSGMDTFSILRRVGEEEKKEKTSPIAKRKHETSGVVHLPSQTLANTIVVYIEEFITYLQ
jgi:hypothetical protein